MDDWIETLKGDGRLYELAPSFPGDPVERRMLLSPEVWGLIDGVWTSRAHERRGGALRAELEGFVMGQELSVSVRPRQAGDADLGLLDPIGDGVWDIRSMDPSPGLRVLGGFIRKDVFVGLLPAARSRKVDWLEWGPLGCFDSEEWKEIIRHTRLYWGRLFPMYPRVPGDNVHDLLSDKFNLD